MPGYKTHIGAGVGLFLLALIVVHNACPVEQVVIGLLAVILGSLFPDIDITSKGQKAYATIVAALVLYCVLYRQYCYLPLLCIGLQLPLLTTHRGLTHNPWFVVGLLFATRYGAIFLFKQEFIYTTWFLFCFGCAALLHILLDLGLIGFCKRLFLARAK